MTANCLKKGKCIHSCFLSSSPIYWGQKQVVIILLYSSLQIADLVSLSKQRFEQLEMKIHDVKAFFDKVQKLNTMKDMGDPSMEENGDLFTLDTKLLPILVLLK